MSASDRAMDQIQLGLINQRNGWHSKAAACFTLAVEADPQSLAAQLLLISALIDADRADAAASALDAATQARLRLGYFSADFRNHAMVHLAGRMFELHDRDRFEIHAYAFGPPSVDLQRKRRTIFRPSAGVGARSRAATRNPGPARRQSPDNTIVR